MPADVVLLINWERQEVITEMLFMKILFQEKRKLFRLKHYMNLPGLVSNLWINPSKRTNGKMDFIMPTT